MVPVSKSITTAPCDEISGAAAAAPVPGGTIKVTAITTARIAITCLLKRFIFISKAELQTIN
jgi:hypothetical protein